MPKPILPPELAAELAPATLLVRGGSERTAYEETSEALFLTSGFVYGSAAEAEAAFKQDGSRYVYSRYRNPTVTMFEERLRLIEGAEACRATASGMAAVFAALLCKLRAGQRVVASRALFGSCYYIVAELLPRYGVETVLVDGRDLSAWEEALAPGAAVAFCESPSNPAMEIIDLAEVARLTHRAGGILVVDNVFATPLLQKPLALGADVVVYSATKHIDGQGRALGGAILASEKYIKDDLGLFYRHTGTVAEPVQRLAVAERAGDAGTARRAAMPHRAGDRALSGNPPEDRARRLSRPAEPSAIRAGMPPDEARAARSSRSTSPATRRPASAFSMRLFWLISRIISAIRRASSRIRRPRRIRASNPRSAPRSASATGWSACRRGLKPKPICLPICPGRWKRFRAPIKTRLASHKSLIL